MDFFTINNIQQAMSFLVQNKEPVVNIHDSSIVDTIYTFSAPDNIIQIYRAKHADFIVTFEATDSRLNLAGDIKPGMSKGAFLKKFCIEHTLCDKFVICDSERTMIFLFLFDKRYKLKRISCNLYLD
jgi:hypothetical protein